MQALRTADYEHTLSHKTTTGWLHALCQWLFFWSDSLCSSGFCPEAVLDTMQSFKWSLAHIPSPLPLSPIRRLRSCHTYRRGLGGPTSGTHRLRQHIHFGTASWGNVLSFMQLHLCGHSCLSDSLAAILITVNSPVGFVHSLPALFYIRPINQHALGNDYVYFSRAQRITCTSLSFYQTV